MGRKLQTEDLLAFQLVGDVQLAPAGDRVLYVQNQVDKEKNSYKTAIYAVEPGQAPVRFTGGDSDSTPRFSPDGSQVAFLSRRSGQTQLWVISTTGGEAWQLTKIQGGVGEFSWSPDGKRIAFSAMLKGDGIKPEVKEEQEDDLFAKHTKKVKVITEQFHKVDGIGYLGERRACLCVIDVAEGAEAKQLTFPPYQVGNMAWSPNSASIFFASRMGEDYDAADRETSVYSISADGGEAKELTPKHLSCVAPTISPDGSTMAVLVFDPEDLGYGNSKLYVMPTNGGEMRRLAADWDYPLDNSSVVDMPAPGGAPITWAPDGSSLYLLSSVRGAVHLIEVNAATGEVTPILEGDRLVYSFGMDTRCRKVAFGAADALNPGDIYLYDLLEATEQRLTQVNEKLLSELELSAPERFCACADSGPQVDGWVIKPIGFTEGQTYPTVLEIHGGPMAMYPSSFFFEFQLLAANGYGVIFSNPRGSQGYGEEFCAAICREWGNRDYADLMAVLDTALAANPWMDQDRLGVTGGSYGGFMTNWIVGHTNRFKAAVSGRSISDWRAFQGTTDFGPYWHRRAGARPWEDDTWYKQQSPLTYVENVVTPILIEHQEGDLRCPIEQGIMWYSAIKLLGKAPTRFVSYPDEFHGMSRNGKPWNRIHRLREIVSWFNTYLKSE